MPSVKLLQAEEAVMLVEDGMRLGLGGSPVTMNPVSLVAHVIERGIKDLDVVVAPIGGFAADMLIGAGAVRSVEFAQVGLEEMGMAPNFRKRSQNGTLQTLDHT